MRWALHLTETTGCVWGCRRTHTRIPRDGCFWESACKQIPWYVKRFACGVAMDIYFPRCTGVRHGVLCIREQRAWIRARTAFGVENQENTRRREQCAVTECYQHAISRLALDVRTRPIMSDRPHLQPQSEGIKPGVAGYMFVQSGI